MESDINHYFATLIAAHPEVSTPRLVYASFNPG
jgi:hypothetical protein